MTSCANEGVHVPCVCVLLLAVCGWVQMQMCICASSVGMHLHECMSVCVIFLPSVCCLFVNPSWSRWNGKLFLCDSPPPPPCVLSLSGAAFIFLSDLNFSWDYFWRSGEASTLGSYVTLNKGMKRYLIHDLSSRLCQLRESTVVSASVGITQTPIRCDEIVSLDSFFMSLLLSLS